MLTGTLTVADRLADIPLPPDGPPGPATLALVLFRQVAERGFACVDNGAPLQCLRIGATDAVPLADAVAALPDTPVTATGGRFDIDDGRTRTGWPPCCGTRSAAARAPTS